MAAHGAGHRFQRAADFGERAPQPMAQVVSPGASTSFCRGARYDVAPGITSAAQFRYKEALQTQPPEAVLPGPPHLSAMIDAFPKRRKVAASRAV